MFFIVSYRIKKSILSCEPPFGRDSPARRFTRLRYMFAESAYEMRRGERGREVWVRARGAGTGVRRERGRGRAARARAGACGARRRRGRWARGAGAGVGARRRHGRAARARARAWARGAGADAGIGAGAGAGRRRGPRFCRHLHRTQRTKMPRRVPRTFASIGIRRKNVDFAAGPCYNYFGFSI